MKRKGIFSAWARVDLFLSLLLLGCVQVKPLWAAAPQSEIKLEFAGRSQSVTLKDLKARLPLQNFTVHDPVYKREKTYHGFWLKDVLKLAGLEESKSAGLDEIVFHCADGYSPTLPYAKLALQQGMLAISDQEYEKKSPQDPWQKIHQGKATLSPGPYYMVWDTQQESYPWPYQLVGIEVIRFQEKYARIYPEGLAKDNPAYKGFEHFRGLCLRCHSLNLQGGVLGPELNIPKNVTEYWDEKTLTEFIRNPGAFRARDKMPAFPQLTDQDLHDVLEYLRWMKGHKKLETP